MSLSADQLTVTYTGKFTGSLTFPRCTGFSVLLPDSISGTPLDLSSEKCIASMILFDSAAAISTNSLTTISFDDLVACGGSMQFSSVPNLSSLSLPAFKYCSAGIILSSPLSALTSFSAPALIGTGFQFSITGASVLTSLSVPSLKYVGQTLTVSTCALLTSLSMPVLTYVNNAVALTSLGSLTSASFPLLAKIGGTTTISSAASLTTISMPSLETLGGDVSFTTSLGEVTTATGWGTVGTLKEVAGNVTFSGQKLTEASVDHILAVMASLDGTGGTVSWGTGRTLTLSGGTNAAPSAAGAADKAIIQARGATVNTN